MKIMTASNYLRNVLIEYKLKPEFVQQEIERFVKENLEFLDVGFTASYLEWRAKQIKDKYESHYNKGK